MKSILGSIMIRAAILGLIINTVTTFLINPSHPHFMISLSINLFLLSVAIGRVFKKQFDINTLMLFFLACTSVLITLIFVVEQTVHKVSLVSVAFAMFAMILFFRVLEYETQFIESHHK